MNIIAKTTIFYNGRLFSQGDKFFCELELASKLIKSNNAEEFKENIEKSETLEKSNEGQDLNLQSKTKEELVEIGKQYSLELKSNSKKEDLIKAIQEVQNGLQGAD